MTGLGLKADLPSSTGFRAWQVELIFAAPIVLFVVYLFYTWFGVLDRYFIFLYFHNMGTGFDTTPFGRVTASRYWMSGLVASGAVMVLYIAANLVLGRVLKRFRPPTWWRLCVLCAIPLSIAIPAIVMTVNDPVLPLANGAQVTAVTLIGLALVVMLGQLAAKRPLAYILLMIDGLGLACLLLSLIRLENYALWIYRGGMGTTYGYLVLALIVLGVGWMIVMTAFRYWRRTQAPSAAAWLVAGLDIAYLLLPLSHHLFASRDYGSWAAPAYFGYISDADNFFARSLPLQIGVWIAVALIALGFTRLRLWLAEHREGARSESMCA